MLRQVIFQADYIYATGNVTVDSGARAETKDGILSVACGFHEAARNDLLRRL
jgi:hypothetical protein